MKHHHGIIRGEIKLRDYVHVHIKDVQNLDVLDQVSDVEDLLSDVQVPDVYLPDVPILDVQVQNMHLILPLLVLQCCSAL